ncbi:hypothetical protein J5S76_16110 [Bacillus amyloliquefaciens]|nr:hypothetical protein [Bacillus amyloliquefaciens]
MKKYIETFYGHRYTCGEMAIALKTRNITEEHLDYVARLSVKRHSLYSSAVNTVNWMITPTKVTAHEFSLKNYLNNKQAYSWAAEVKDRVVKLNNNALPFFSPFILCDLNLMFKYDTHWTPLGAYKYFESFFYEIGILDSVSKHINLIDNKSKLHGNCQINGENLGEHYIDVSSIKYINLFKTPIFPTPDLNIEINKSCNHVIDEKVLIIHSSSYQFCRKFVTGLFRETVEIFCPYIPADIIRIGTFDRIIMQSAERNIAVAYDGTLLNNNILSSINNDKTKTICNYVLNTVPELELPDSTKAFLIQLAKHWSHSEIKI